MAVTVNGGDVTVGVMVAKTIEVDVVKTGKILVVVDVTVTVTACEARLKVLPCVTFNLLLTNRI